MHVLAREKEKVRNQPAGGLAMLQVLLHFPLEILGMYVHMPGSIFKRLGLGLEPEIDYVGLSAYLLVQHYILFLKTEQTEVFSKLICKIFTCALYSS